MIASLSGLLFGCDTGAVSSALLFLKTQYPLSPAMQEVVTGVVLVGAVLGAAGSGRLVDRVSRRPLLLWGLAGMIAGLTFIGLSFHLHGLGRLQGLLAAGSLLVTVSFLTLVHGLRLSWTFWAYGLVSIAAWFFAKRFVPETKGRSLEQIEKELAGSKEAA